MSIEVHGNCERCDDPVSVNAGGWYRCRSCGHESLRDSPSLDIAKALYTHWCSYDAPDPVSESQLRHVARESIRQGDLFADELAKVRL